MRALITGGGGQLAADLQALQSAHDVSRRRVVRNSTSPTRRRWTARLQSSSQTIVFNCAAFHNVEVCERRARTGVAGECRGRPSAGAAQPAARAHLSTNYVFDGRPSEPYGELDRPSPRSASTRSPSSRESTPPWRTRRRRSWCAPPASTGCTAVRRKGGNFVTANDRPRTRAGRAASGRRPAPARRRSPRIWRRRSSRQSSAAQPASLHLTRAGSAHWFEFTEAIMRLAGIDVPIEQVQTTIPRGGVDRPLNGVLARPRADALGLPALRRLGGRLSRLHGARRTGPGLVGPKLPQGAS